jgi:hypothetical protein
MSQTTVPVVSESAVTDADLAAFQDAKPPVPCGQPSLSYPCV